MEALVLIVHMLEKVSVLVSATLVLLLLRPAQSWLEETGSRVSLRRGLFLIMIFAPLAVWGVFLSYDIRGLGFNTRSIGIIVAGYLGGTGVGLTVGLIAGLVYAFLTPWSLSPFVLMASIINGVVAAWWVKRFGSSMLSITMGAVVAQVLHHIIVGALYFLFDDAQAVRIASNIGLHVAKITANTIGVVLFMGLLRLTRDLDRARTEARRSRDQMRSARLETLQYQLRPHFLFNLLNTLAYLIRTNPAKARELTLELADFLRYTLTKEDQQTTIHQELEQIERYVELERARFGDGLSFSIHDHAPQWTDRVSVPPLILQPLVENAIKHGAQDGEVDISIDLDVVEDALHITITDSGPGPQKAMDEILAHVPKRHQSIGLSNVKARLESYYHGRADLTLHTITSEDASTVGAQARIVLPLNMPADEPTGFAQKAQARIKDVVIPSSEKP